MSHTETTLRPDIFGASVRGPGHVADQMPNQDAWGHGRTGSLSIVVVSDGLGSRRYSREGSRAACESVVSAARQWARFPASTPDIFLGLVHLMWRARISPRLPSDCACTCLFTAVRPDGTGIVAQLGDGLILMGDSGNTTPLVIRSDDDFANETQALGMTQSLSSWKVKELETGIQSVILCTDGVADDLRHDRYGIFADWLCREIRNMTPRERSKTLARELRSWPTPHHIDDKTIAVVCIDEGSK